jgi:hypothetical protein
MKLMVVTAIRVYESDIKKIMKEASISAYTYKHVVGFKDSSLDSISTNWFGTEMCENESVLFFAMVDSAVSENAMAFIERFNQSQESSSRVHVAILDIEKTN